MEFHRGRLIDHILITVRDIEVSKAFYTAILAEIGVPIDREGEDWYLADELMFKQSEQLFGRVQLAFQAASKEDVDYFLKARLPTTASV